MFAFVNVPPRMLFEDAYAKHRHWQKLEYKDDALKAAVERAATWAEKFVGEFGDYQAVRL
jgi:hypothetical protein